MEKQIERPCPLGKGRMICLVLNYFLGYNFLYPLLLRHITLWLDPTARAIPDWMQYAVYIYMMIISIVLAYPLLQESLTTLRQRKTHVVKSAFLLMIGYYIASIFLNVILMQFTDTTTSANQSEIIHAVEISPWLTLFTTIIYAPIVEEILFRGVFYRALRPHLSMCWSGFISAFAFGFIHVMTSFFTGDFGDMIYLFSYALIGLFLVMAYDKNDTIYASILLHFINNALAFLLLFAP